MKNSNLPLPGRLNLLDEPKSMVGQNMEPIALDSARTQATLGEVTAMVGMALLSIEVAKADAVNLLENSPNAIRLLERLVMLKGKSIQTPVRLVPVTPAAMPPAEAPVTTATSPAVKGVTTAQIVEAFGHLVSINLGKAMTDKALWTKDARITSGTRGGKHKTLWNPVILATALHERSSTPMMKLNQAFNTFRFLADWREEWNRFSAM